MRRPALLIAGTALAAVGLGLASNQPAHAWHQPYGGCKEAALYPHSKGADECRAHGWTIKESIVVTGHGVMVADALPHCREEDGSGQRSACTWNLHRTDGADHKPDGNGQGLSYWVSRSDRIHYVWPERPLGEPTPSELADALAEGMVDEDWKKCWLDEPRTHVRCPDGYETRVYGQRR